MKTVKVFRNGGSQAVRLPKEFQLPEDEEICIKRVGDMIYLFPKSKVWELFRQSLEEFSDEFMSERDQGFPEEVKPLDAPHD